MKRADRWAGEPFNREPDKCCELAWVDPDALPNDVIAYPAAALAHVQQGAVFSLHGWTTPIA